MDKLVDINRKVLKKVSKKTSIYNYEVSRNIKLEK